MILLGFIAIWLILICLLPLWLSIPWIVFSCVIVPAWLANYDVRKSQCD